MLVAALVHLSACAQSPKKASHSVQSASAEKFVFSENDGNMTVELIENCGMNPRPELNTFVFYNQQTNLFKGWSHVSNPANAALYADVKHTPADPRYYLPLESQGQPVTRATIKPDSTCNNISTYESILVRKYNGPGSRHLNGIEPRFEAANITFDQLDAIVIEMKIDTKGSNIYS